MPTRSDTISAARRRDSPAATSSATAASAGSSPLLASGAVPGPSTSVISPFGGAPNRSTSSAAVPRTTSSNRFVSSRQTATSRFASATASERSVAGSRCGDSKATAGHGQPRRSSHNAASFDSPRGRNPRKRYCSATRPEATSAVSTADAPGRTVTSTPASSAARRSRTPGSDTPGGPPAGVGPRGGPGGGEGGDPPPRLEPRQELGGPPSLVVLVVREQPRLDPMPLEQTARVARVLAQDHVCGGELGEHAQRHVLEVADRRRADRERHYAVSSASKATKAAPMKPAAVPSSAFASRTELRIGSRAPCRATSSAGPRR